MADEQNSTTTVPGGATDGIDALSYEQAREELVTTVRTLEAGSLTLEESLRLWERGEALADRCQNWLDGAARPSSRWVPSPRPAQSWQRVPRPAPRGAAIPPGRDSPIAARTGWTGRRTAWRRPVPLRPLVDGRHGPSPSGPSPLSSQFWQRSARALTLRNRCASGAGPRHSPSTRRVTGRGRREKACAARRRAGRAAQAHQPS